MMENTFEHLEQQYKVRKILDTPNRFPKPPHPMALVVIFGAGIVLL